MRKGRSVIPHHASPQDVLPGSPDDDALHTGFEQARRDPEGESFLGFIYLDLSRFYGFEVGLHGGGFGVPVSLRRGGFGFIFRLPDRRRWSVLDGLLSGDLQRDLDELDRRVQVELDRVRLFLDIQMDGTFSLKSQPFEVRLEQQIIVRRDDLGGEPVSVPLRDGGGGQGRRTAGDDALRLVDSVHDQRARRMV